ncbi:hypothetical protein [Gaiella sp.]
MAVGPSRSSSGSTALFGVGKAAVAEALAPLLPDAGLVKVAK